MVDAILKVVQIAIGVLVLAVAVGRWGGRLEMTPARRSSASEPPVNGTPSNGELLRRFELLEQEFREDRRNYLALGEANAKFDGLWGAYKGLREIVSAQQRRIDGMMGQP